MILFTADLHFRLSQKNVPKDWALNRYRLFFEKVYELETKVDLHIIGGDIFDRLPSMEELELYFDFLKGISIPTIIFSGNHEATKKGHTFLSHLKKATESINPLVKIIDEVYETDDYYIVPYEFIKKKGLWESLNEKPVFTHVRGEIPPHVKPEIDLELLTKFPIVYAGDLHSHSNTQRNIVYPGSPLTTSFHRTRVSTGCLLIDSRDLTKWTWHELELPQLIRKTVSSEEDMLPTHPDHTIYELEGDLLKLSGIKDSELLDKKIVKRVSDTSLLLNPNMTLIEELKEYLLYILTLPEKEVEELIGVYNDYIENARVE